MRTEVRLLGCTVLLAGLLFANPARAGKVPCERVIAELDQAAETAELGEADASDIGEKLKTDPVWVERCAQTYGRRLSRGAKARHNSDEAGDPSEAWETDEPEEVAPEEHAAQGEVYEADIPEEKPRKDLPGDPHEWNPPLTHEWNPNTGAEWQPVIHDDDLPPP